MRIRFTRSARLAVSAVLVLGCAPILGGALAPALADTSGATADLVNAPYYSGAINTADFDVTKLQIATPDSGAPDTPINLGEGTVGDIHLPTVVYNSTPDTGGSQHVYACRYKNQNYSGFSGTAVDHSFASETDPTGYTIHGNSNANHFGESSPLKTTTVNTDFKQYVGDYVVIPKTAGWDSVKIVYPWSRQANVVDSTTYATGLSIFGGFGQATTDVRYMTNLRVERTGQTSLEAPTTVSTIHSNTAESSTRVYSNRYHDQDSGVDTKYIPITGGDSLKASFGVDVTHSVQSPLGVSSQAKWDTLESRNDNYTRLSYLDFLYVLKPGYKLTSCG